MENMRNCAGCEREGCNSWQVGMGYVPWQNLDKVYEPAQALRTGTLFPELEKPFYGCMKGGRR